MLSIVLPCYNPPVGWAEKVLSNYIILSKRISDTIEIILVNDGSTKNTDKEEIAKLESTITHFTYIDNKENHGKGYAIRAGVEKAEGDIIIYTDIDFPYSIDSLLKIYKPLSEKQCKIAIGIKDKVYYKGVPFMRKVISKTLRAMTKTLLSIPVTDTQCGLKGFSKEVSSVFTSTTIDRYLFDIEFIRNASKRNIPIVAISVVLNEGVEFRRMNYKILIPEMMNFIKLLFK